MEIPYTITARPDTGLWNAKIGIWLFLASEVMLFGALFSAYVFLRIGADAANPWPHGLLNVPVGTFNTVVLISSSMTMVMAWASLKMRKFAQYKVYMGITILCAMMFLCIKAYEYNDKFHHYGVFLKSGQVITGHLEENTPESLTILPDIHHEGKHFWPEREHGAPIVIKKSDIRRWSNFTPKYSPFFAIYFTLTGLHGLHVFGGMCVNIYFWMPGSKLYKTNPEHLANRVEVSGLFWHFVDLVWIFLFPVLYLL